jgi:hypothetical protein
MNPPSAFIRAPLLKAVPVHKDPVLARYSLSVFLPSFMLLSRHQADVLHLYTLDDGSRSGHAFTGAAIDNMANLSSPAAEEALFAPTEANGYRRGAQKLIKSAAARSTFRRQ